MTHTKFAHGIRLFFHSSFFNFATTSQVKRNKQLRLIRAALVSIGLEEGKDFDLNAVSGPDSRPPKLALKRGGK